MLPLPGVGVLASCKALLCPSAGMSISVEDADAAGSGPLCSATPKHRCTAQCSPGIGFQGQGKLLTRFAQVRAAPSQEQLLPNSA